MDLTKLCAKDLMHKDVKTVDEMTSVEDAVRMMLDSNVSSLVVEPNDDNDAFGIVTRKDFVEAFMSGVEAARVMLVEEIMTKPVITVHPDLAISQCYQMMRLMGVRRVPVVDGKDLVGIFSSTDLFRCFEKGL